MINCPNCNHQNPDGALQCEACYTPLPALAICPTCNASVQADASFCGQCGTDLRDKDLTANTGQNIATEVNVATEVTGPTQAVFPQTPEPESEAKSEVKTQNFLVPPEGSSEPSMGIPDLVPPDPLVIPEPISHESSAGVAPDAGNASGTELSSGASENLATAEPEPVMAEPSVSETASSTETAPLSPPSSSQPATESAAVEQPLVEQPFVEQPFVEPPASEPPASEPPAPPPIPTPVPAVRRSPATQLQIASVRLKHVQTDTPIELPRGLSVVRIGKPNDHTPPDIDLSGFPDSEIVSRVHASIRVEGDTYFLEDVGSSNGTYINGLPLPVGNRHRLRPGDRIAFGKGDKVSFLFEMAS
ncbi:MAG: FHA domain-containing protein [Cyanobacteria bacterium P01_F01_bin.3]